MQKSHVFVKKVISKCQFKSALEHEWSTQTNRKIRIRKKKCILYYKLSKNEQKRNQTNRKESKFKNRKHLQIIHNFDQPDLNDGELP